MADNDRPGDRLEPRGQEADLDGLDRPDSDTAGDAPVLIAHGEMWAAPLPPPSLLVEYDRVVQNGAERILSMAEKQSNHRMRMEATEVSSEHTLAQRGQWIGMAVVLAVLMLAGYLAYLGATAAAAVVASIDVVGLAAVFVYGSVRKRSAREIDVEDAELIVE